MINLIAAYFLFIGVFGSTPFIHPEKGFSIEVPTSWAAVDSSFYMFHWREVYVAFNSIGDPNLLVKTWRVATSKKTSTEYAGSDAAVHYLALGTVYFDIGIRSGGPPRSIRPYAWFPEDAIEFKIKNFLYLKRPLRETKDLTTYALTFPKFGEEWDIRIYCRKPFNQNDLNDAFEAIESFRFLPLRRKLTAAAAVDAVIPHLPVEAQPNRDWPMQCGGMANYYKIDTEIDPANGFIVTITTLDGSMDRNPIKTYKYLVTEDMKVFPSERGPVLEIH